MDNQQTPYSNMYEQPSYQDKRSSTMATISLVLGIIAVVSCGCIYLSMITGALGIIFALLSRGGETTMSKTAKAGLILGIIGLVLTFAFYICVFAYAMYKYGGIDGIMQQYLNMYGVDSIEQLYNTTTF